MPGSVPGMGVLGEEEHLVDPSSTEPQASSKTSQSHILAKVRKVTFASGRCQKYNSAQWGKASCLRKESFLEEVTLEG